MLKQLQAEHRAWLETEYPGQPASHPAAGIVEESAELLHTVLKMDQERMYGRERRHVGKDWRAELVDALADCGIFLCSLCNSLGWDFEKLCMVTDACPPADDVLDGCLTLVHIACDNARAKDFAPVHYARYAWQLRRVSLALHISFEEALAVTWADVKERSHK